MTGNDFVYLRETVETEGFDEAFANYSDFENIKDENFHRIRTAYLGARGMLAEYCGLKEFA